MKLAAVARLFGRRGRCLVLAALAVGATGAFACPALAVSPAKWGITMTDANPYGQEAGECPEGKAHTTPACGINPFTEGTGDEGVGGEGKTFARESGWNEYKITVTNTGETSSVGKVTVVDKLPPGLVLHANTEHEEAGGPGWENEPGKGRCKVLNYGTSVECSSEEALAAGKPFKPIILHVNVLPQAANVSTNVATVSGGGSVPASTEGEDVTKVTKAVPFGIASFSANVFKEPKDPATEPLSEPFTQAGGHPFAISTEIVFNYTTGDDTGGRLVPAGGPTKEVQAETPPGVTGDVQNMPQCPNALLARGHCPPNTAVGYVSLVALADHKGEAVGEIVGGKARVFPPVPKTESELEATGQLGSFVYNMQPTPGAPAQFGFDVLSVPVILEAKLRSDGDYGVTVGDNATARGSQEVMGIKLTFCKHGASGTLMHHFVDFEVNRHCDAAPASSTPFLTNPTQCSGPAPAWTLMADPWDEPTNYKPQTVGVNLVEGALSKQFELSKQSFVEGCESLQFHPELESKPSPPPEGGSTLAGEPTGMTLDLKVPQTNEGGVNATPAIRNAVVTLPAGMTLSASAADGLQACSNAQFGLGTEFGPGSKHSEPAKPASCPPASQIGTAEIFTPLLSAAPAIEGPQGKVEGEEYVGALTCSPGTWNGSPTFTYRWLRDGKEIEKATGREYAVVPEEDEGQALQCQVTATNAAGSSVAVSRDVVGLVEPFKGEIEEKKTIVKGVTKFTGVTVKSELKGVGIAPGTTVISVNVATKELTMSLAATKTEITTITPTPVPPFPPSSIAASSGIASAGNALTCEPGAWTGSPTFSYQWLRNGHAIPGASAETYSLASGDEGKAIQCRVTGKNEVTPGEEGVIADSAARVVSPEPSPAPPLLGAPVQGGLFVGEPECGNANYPEPCTNEYAEGKGGPSHEGALVRLFLQAQDPLHCLEAQVKAGTCSGVIIKQVGKGTLNPLTGQVTTTFSNAPQQPFELLRLRIKGGPRAPLANSQSCGPARTETDLTPWSAPGLGGLSGSENILGTPDAFPSSSYEVTGCGPAQFAPTFNAGTTNTQAGAFTPLTLTFSRTDSDQDLATLTVHTPPGLAGMLSNVALCPEAQANAGTCPPASQIGTTETGAGPGTHPLYLGGKVYLTGPYKGQPFGMSVAVPAIAGPFNLGMVVVRSSIHIDPYTAAVTVTSDPFPKILDGVPTHIKQVKVNIDRKEFIFNPTNCSPQQISATLTSVQGASAQVSSPFGIGGCTSLPFRPTLTASTQGETSKANGASLSVKVTSGPGQANIGKTTLILPRSLPSRLTTIQKACVARVFNANPAACPEGSVVGTATAHTPVLKSPLTGPAYLVSHGGAAFPDVEFVLQGEGITLDLDGQTDIKNGVTSSTFNALPDAPVGTFETVLPEGPHSALAALGNLCTQSLEMPTTITGQNGAVITQDTHIAVTGCPPTVTILSTKLTGSALLVTVRTSATGTVWISGYGLKTTKNNLKAGTHQLRVAFTKTGTSMRKHHKKTSVRVKLTVGKQAVAQATTVRL